MAVLVAVGVPRRALRRVVGCGRRGVRGGGRDVPLPPPPRPTESAQYAEGLDEGDFSAMLGGQYAQPTKQPRGKPKIKPRTPPPGQEHDDYNAAAAAAAGGGRASGDPDGALPPNVVPEGTKSDGQKFTLTLNPNTAHIKQAEEYDRYVDFMKDAMAMAPMTRRRAIIASMPPEELVRRSKEYGVWGSVFAPPADNDRWRGTLVEARMPQRFRTFRATAVRFSMLSLAWAAGLSAAWLICMSKHSEYIGNYIAADSWGLTIPGFTPLIGLDAKNWLLPGELQRPFMAPVAPIDGETPDEGERPCMIRLARWKLEFEHRNYSAEREAKTRAAAEAREAELAAARERLDAARRREEEAAATAAKQVVRDGKVWVAL